MKHRITFGVLKTYSGILTKHHIGNVQLIIIEMSKKFLMLNVIGQNFNDQHVCQVLLKGPAEHANKFIDKFEEDGSYIPMEEIICNIPNENDDHFKVILKKKGKYLNSHYTFTLSKEASIGSIKIYNMDGKFTPLLVEKIDKKSQIRIKALKKQTLSKPLLTKFMASIKR